jgi:carboxyl-terminal processing protease
MNKLLILLVVFFGSLTFMPFDKGSVIAGSNDSIKHLIPEEKYTEETKIIMELLERYHYRKQPLNDSLSSVILDNYVTSLDYNKSFFLQSDIDSFEPYRFEFDDVIEDGDMNIAFDIFNVFQDRFIERMAYVDTLLNHEFDFTKSEVIETNRDELVWATTADDLNETWRKSLKSQVLNLKLTGKDIEASYEVIDKRYDRYRTVIRQYKSSDVYQIFMNAFTESYDPHTNYFNPITAENFDIEMSRSLEGIGARLSKEGDYTIVVDIVAGGPAYRSNSLHKDDRITGVGQDIDGEIVDVVGWRNDDVVQLIRGKKGTTVRLEILEAEEGANATPKVITLVRDKINLDDQKAKSKVIPFSKNGTIYNMGVITVPDFYKDFSEEREGNENFNSTTRDVKKLLEDLNAQNIDGLLIDLRRNGGGSLDEAIELSGLFIKDGPVVQVRDRQDKIDIGKDEDSGVYYDGPLTVLINRSSASASEIFSGAIQDYKRGVILGEQSYGKGTVQNYIDLNRVVRKAGNEYGNLKITLAKYYRITGSSTQQVGVTPDIGFPSSFDPESFGEGALPGSLPWDQIDGTPFESTDLITEGLLDMLNKEYISDLNSDSELRDLIEDIQKNKERRNQTQVSLNEAQRIADREDSSEDDEDTSGVLNENSTISTETGTTTDTVELDDIFLKEGLRLLATIVENHIG